MLGLGLFAVLLLAWLAPERLPYLVAALLGAGVLVVLFRHDLLNLCVLIGSFALVSDFEAGFQIEEVLYGLYFFAYVGYWYASRLIFYRDTIVHRFEERVLVFFLIGASLALPTLTLLFGGSLRAGLSEWIALMLLALYFPIKEALSGYRNGPVALIVTLGWVGTYASVRNVLQYRRIISDMEFAWQVMNGRVVTNEMLLLLTAMGALVFLVATNRWRSRVVMTGLLMVYMGSLILTQSRSYWLAFLLGSAMVFLVAEAAYRRRMLVAGTTGGLLLFLAALVLFGDTVLLIGTGLLERFATIGSAATADLSVVNRFAETSAVWDEIIHNPVLGYGPGVSFQYFSLIEDRSEVRTFIHNGYAGIWYKYGLWGLLSALTVWLTMMWRGLQTYRMWEAPLVSRLSGLIAAACLCAFLFSTAFANPFHLRHTVFVLAVLFGLAGGSYHRVTSSPQPTGIPS